MECCSLPLLLQIFAFPLRLESLDCFVILEGHRYRTFNGTLLNTSPPVESIYGNLRLTTSRLFSSSEFFLTGFFPSEEYG